jgi:hypothetical protein
MSFLKHISVKSNFPAHQNTIEKTNMKLKPTHLAALTCAAIIGSAALSQAATIAWNFDTPSLEGWVVAGTQYGVASAEGGQSGSFYLGVTSGDTDTDTTVHVMRSPTIQFDLTSGLSAYLRKGHANNALVQTNGIVGGTTTNDGFRGIALFDVATNDYVLTTGKTLNNNDWDSVGWTVGDLTTAGVTISKQYELHLIDQATGGWGHIQLDTVSFNGAVIPEPSAALLGGLGMLALLRRRRA